MGPQLTAMLTAPMAAFAVMVIGCALALAWAIETPQARRIGPFLWHWFPLIVMPALLALSWLAILS